MKGTKVCSAKPGRNVHVNVHTKRERTELLRKLTELGKDVKSYAKEVTLRHDIRLINLNIQP
jgi:Zn-finger protein